MTRIRSAIVGLRADPVSAPAVVLISFVVLTFRS